MFCRNAVMASLGDDADTPTLGYQLGRARGRQEAKQCASHPLFLLTLQVSSKVAKLVNDWMSKDLLG